MIINGDVREILPTLSDESVDCIITSPPYYQLRDYGMEQQIGKESTYQSYLKELTDIFIECKRILKPTGTLWINLGDKYSGSNNGAGSIDKLKPYLTQDKRLKTDWSSNDIPNRNLMLLPFRLADSLIRNGWILRNDIIWYKPNAMPAGGRVINKFTNSYEHILFFTKVDTGYYFDYQSVMEEAKYEGFKDVVKLGYQSKYKESEVSKISSEALNETPDAIKKLRKKYSTKLPPIGGRKYPGNIDNHNYSGNILESTGKRLRRDMWEISTQPFLGAHFACFPEKLVEICVLAGCRGGGGGHGYFLRIRNHRKSCIRIRPRVYRDRVKSRICRALKEEDREYNAAVITGGCINVISV